MLTLRHLPALAEHHPNHVLRYYYRGLLEHWSATDRILGRMLCLRETGFGGPVRRRALGIARDEWLLALGRVDPEQMLTMRARKGLHQLINAAAIPLKTSVLKDKHRFDALAHKVGLCVPERFEPETESLAAWLDRQQAIMVKPNFSSKGRGVRRLDKCSAGNWSERLSGASAICTVGSIQAASAEGAVLQEAINTHIAVAPISPNALSTMRVVTMRNESDDFEIVARILRVGGGNHPVDNFNRGGLASMASAGGKLGLFFKHDKGLAPRPVNSHPANDAPLPAALPTHLAADIDRLSTNAHRLMVPDHALVGWDIGLGENGAVLIEGNWNPGTNVTQLLGGESVCTARSGELYFLALRQLDEAAWVAARPIQHDNAH